MLNLHPGISQHPADCAKNTKEWTIKVKIGKCSKLKPVTVSFDKENHSWDKDNQQKEWISKVK